MKVLVVAMDLDSTAPGVVFKHLVRGLSDLAQCTVVAPSIDADFLEGHAEIIKAPSYEALEWCDIIKLWKKFHFNPHDSLWWRKARRAVMPELRGKNFDYVISFTSMNYFPSINLGRALAKKLGSKWAVYSVDGIPSPVEWLGVPEMHGKLSSYLDKRCRDADMFFSSNPYMLEYEKTVLRSFRGGWNFLFTPCFSKTRNIPRTMHKGIRILYAGSLYGLRRIDGLAEAFRTILREEPESMISFVGDADPACFDCARDLVDSGKIKSFPFSRDLSEYIAESDILLDIAADIDNDVFLSSKIVNYLSVNRPVVAVSGANSPARGIMGGLKSIFHCGNDAKEIRSAVLAAMSCKDFSDRAALLDEFSEQTVARKLFDSLS